METLKAIDYRVGYREIISPFCFFTLVNYGMERETEKSLSKAV